MPDPIPEVSVVIPCYNGERFIAEAIESVLRQTQKDFEILIVDDGSTDGSADVVGRFQENGRVRFFRHDSNKGIAAARNTGIKNAAGRYIGFLDQDDLWREDKLAVQLRAIEDQKDAEVFVVFSAVAVEVLSGGKSGYRNVKVPANIENLEPDALIAQLFLRHFISVGSALIRKECFDSVGLMNEEILSGSDDFDLLIRLAHHYRFFYVDKPLAVRREHGGNFTDAAKMMPESLKILDRVIKDRPSLAHIRGKVRNRFLYSMARDQHVKGEYFQAMKVYKEAIAEHPRSIKPYLALLLCITGKLGDKIYNLFVR